MLLHVLVSPGSVKAISAIRSYQILTTCSLPTVRCFSNGKFEYTDKPWISTKLPKNYESITWKTYSSATFGDPLLQRRHRVAHLTRCGSYLYGLMEVTVQNFSSRIRRFTWMTVIAVSESIVALDILLSASVLYVTTFIRRRQSNVFRRHPIKWKKSPCEYQRRTLSWWNLTGSCHPFYSWTTVSRQSSTRPRTFWCRGPLLNLPIFHPSSTLDTKCNAW